MDKQKISVGDHILSMLNPVLELANAKIISLEIDRESILRDYSEDELRREEFIKVVQWGDVLGATLNFVIQASVKASEMYEFGMIAKLRIDEKGNIDLIRYEIIFVKLPRGKEWVEEVKRFLEKWGYSIIVAIIAIIKIFT